MMVRKSEWASQDVNLGGIAEAEAFVPCGAEVFFVFKKSVAGNDPSIRRPSKTIFLEVKNMKKNTLKKLTALALAAVMALSLFACGKKTDDDKTDGKTYKIGICNYVDDASLNQIVANIRSQLEAIGQEKGVTFDISYDNCNADAAVMNQIIANFIADKVDLMIGVATPVAVAMQSATEDNNIPVVFAADPDAKTIGLLYDQGQDSPTTPIKNAKAYLDKKNVAYKEYTGTTTDEIMLAAGKIAADKVDAVFTPTDNTVMTAELSIYETLAKAGIPHYTGADSFALNGAFLGYGVDYVNLGKETANMVADLLLNGAAPATTAVKTFDNGTATINTEVCQQLGLNYDELTKLFAPLCTKVQPIVTAESFDDVK